MYTIVKKVRGSRRRRGLLKKITTRRDPEMRERDEWGETRVVNLIL